MKKILPLLILLIIISYSLTYKTTKLEKEITYGFGGGGTLPSEAYEEFIKAAGGKNAKLLLVCNASCINLKIGDICKYIEKYNIEMTCNVEEATCIWFGGGDQKRLLDTWSPSLLKSFRGTAIGGTSAGASALGKIMPYQDNEVIGYGLINTIIDQHFTQRDRIFRLKKLCEKHKLLGIGIDEDTALIIKGKDYRVIGNGCVQFIRQWEPRDD